MAIRDIYICGAGGFGREIKMIIDQINEKKKIWNIAGFIDDSKKQNSKVIDTLKVVGDSKSLSNIKKDVDVVIPIGKTHLRENFYNKFKKNTKLKFPNIFHPSVTIEKSTLKLGKGNIFLTNSVISTCVEFGDFNIINMGAIVGHNVKLGNFTTINPNCNIGGGVTVGNHCYFGIGCSVIQYVNIPSNVKIAGNSFVMKDCESNFLYIGIPAKKSLPLTTKL